MKPDALEATRDWVEEFVIGLDLCPFARKPTRAGRVRFTRCDSDKFELQLEAFIDEVEHLIRTPPATLSNTLLVLPSAPQAFDPFLDLAAAAEAVIEDLEVDHLVQIASFHPQYTFDGATSADPANATNRSPHPMLHLLRVDEVEDAIVRHPDVDSIPRRNADLLRSRNS